MSQVVGNLVGAGGIDNQGTLDLDGTPALKLTGGLVNSGAIEIDGRFGSDGGGSLTVTGILANSGTVQIGNNSLSGAAPVSLGGLVTAAASSPLTYIAGAGIDKFTGGVERDTVMVSRAPLARDTLTGGGGLDTLAPTSAGALNITGVGGFETYRLASGAANSLSSTTANFAGVSGRRRQSRSMAATAATR